MALLVVTARQRGEYIPAGKHSPAGLCPETPEGLENDPRGLGKHPQLLVWSKNNNQGKLSVSHGEGETQNPKGCLCL